jgi:hypothetical protein
MAENESEVEKKDLKTTKNDSSSERPTSADVESGQVEEKAAEEEDKEANEITKPDGGWGWFVCFGAFICNFVVFGTHNSFGVIYGTLIKELRISSAETGMTPLYILLPAEPDIYYNDYLVSLITKIYVKILP